ncbi:MAG: hypothetical protein QOE33_3479 [Acidobacteriota bacterium]|nr:hypothetical protein [Acidobacteriota bacterium]
MTAALTNGPIGFTDASGKQVFIPLSSIYFDNTGAIKADQWGPYIAKKVDQASVNAWLQYLVLSGLIVPDTAPPPKAAMVIKSKDSGTAGNNIKIEFANVNVNANSPGDSKLDMAITETDTYVGLKPSTIASVLGTDTPSAGSQPGLVHLKGNAAPTLPDNGDYPLTKGGPAATAWADITKNGGGGTAFTLEAKRKGDDGNLTKVSIKKADPATGTFDLIATWSKSLVGVKVSDVPAGSGYELEVTAPPGGVLAAPVAGVVMLSGGADTQAATPASLTVLASQ